MKCIEGKKYKYLLSKISLLEPLSDYIQRISIKK